MPEQPSWSAEPEKQAEYLNEFKKQTGAELAAIKARLVWLLMPTFLMLVAVLGLTYFTFRMVTDVLVKVGDTERAVGDLKLAIKKQAADAQQTRPMVLPNGLTDAERLEFYHLAEGSEVFPLEWLQALENSATGNPFMDDLADMGFVKDWDPSNRDGLPVGLTSSPARGLEPLGKIVGLNCAACHVGEMSYKGTRVRIDGAPNVLDTRTFFASLIESSFATIKDSDKLLAFIDKVKKNRAEYQAPEARVRLSARLVGLLKTKAETVLVKAMVPLINKIIEEEANEKDESKQFDLVGSLKDGKADPKTTRAKWLAKFDNSRVKKLLDNSELKNKLVELAKDDDHEGTLVHTFEEIYIGVRLLKARAVFLKKLGMVGTDKRTEWGPGRVDAFGSARAFLFTPKGEKPYSPVNAVSYPPIFELKSHDWFHYDNNTTTFLERNFGQALGVGAVYDPETLESTLQAKNLRRLEALARKLTAPKWPEEVFGKIDPEKAARGKKLYVKYCADCHDEGKDGKLADRMFDLDDIKTDVGRANMFADKLADGKPFAEAIKDTMYKLKMKEIEIGTFSKEEAEEIKKEPVAWRGVNKYSARTLKGSWSTAPYLHNGSVPTMDDLLKPADQRPKKFYVGSREFDVEKLGYVSDESMKPFDATTEGNKNIGHEGDRYGTQMSADERRDLLEYLKAH